MQKKTVVYIEDRAEDVLLFKRVVKKEFTNVELITLDDSEEVLENIENKNFSKLEASVVLIDINMPRISGLELLKAFNNYEVYKKLPKIIFSSSKERSDINKAYELNCNSYIEKSKSFTELKEKLKETLNYWLNTNLN